MRVVINPGSGAIPEAGDGWTNTVERARKYATEWFSRMLDDGIEGVYLMSGEEFNDGRWVFRFKHRDTKKIVELEHHGIDDLGAYEKERVFAPRVYWDGSSVGSPAITDWLIPGFRVSQSLVLDARLAKLRPNAAQEDEKE